MKEITLLFCVLILQIKGYIIQEPTSTIDTSHVRVGWVHMQKLLLPLFENVCEESTDPVVVRLSEEFQSDPYNGVYLEPKVLDNLQNLRSSKGLLSKGEIFSEYNAEHFNEFKIIYEVLYYSKDFDTFYKATCWARQNVNCGLFVDAIYLAILNRRDTENISIPAPYELLPNYFIRKDFIFKASSLIRGGISDLSDYVRNVGNSYILDVNYTRNFYDESDDKLAYFHEDVGLNSFYFLKKLKTINWISNSRYSTNNGESLYHVIKQMMARYNLERYSNGLPELEGLDWDNLNDLYSYDPMLIYSNGKDFSRSSTNGDIETIRLLKNIENNIPTVVLHMRDGGYKKSEIIDHLMEILIRGENSYEKLALQMLTGDKIVSSEPSVLEHFMTTARDPLFWKLNKKMVDIIDNALQVLPSYTRDQLYFPGVEVQNIEIKKMSTSFENFEFDVTSALKTENEDTKFQVKISQSRLSSKPFTFKISVSSFVAQRALVRVYIGPKMMPGQLIEKKNMLMLLDSFEYNLKIGSNVITRASQDMKLSDDLVSLETIRKRISDAEFGIDTLTSRSIWSQIEFPSRLILPKGTPEGLPLHVFVFISPYIKPTRSGSKTNMEINYNAIFSPGFPLDLDIEIQQLFNMPNALVKDIVITHKAESASYGKGGSGGGRPSNVYNSNTNNGMWQNDNFDNETPSGLLTTAIRPEFTKKSFDYKSKKNNYGKKSDYAAKREENKYQKYKTQDVTRDSSNIEEEKEDVKVINNNIYITPDLNHEITTDYTENKNVFDKTPLDLDLTYNTYRVDSVNKFQNNDDDEIIEDLSNIKPHFLLKLPKKRFSNIFNIIFKPLKIDSDEELFE